MNLLTELAVIADECGQTVADIRAILRMSKTDAAVLTRGTVTRLSYKHHHHIVTRAHRLANLIHKRFTSGDQSTLMRAFVTYVRPLLEYASCVWSPYTIGKITKIKVVQCQFTKRFLCSTPITPSVVVVCHILIILPYPELHTFLLSPVSPHHTSSFRILDVFSLIRDHNQPD